jgi:predicted nucleic acid-binding protein
MGIALLDTSVVIGALHRDDALHQAAGRASGRSGNVMPSPSPRSPHAEILVGPLRAGGRAVEVVERFTAQVRVVDLSPDIARLAAQLRGRAGSSCPTR